MGLSDDAGIAPGSAVSCPGLRGGCRLDLSELRSLAAGRSRGTENRDPLGKLPAPGSIFGLRTLAEATRCSGGAGYPFKHARNEEGRFIGLGGNFVS